MQIYTWLYIYYIGKVNLLKWLKWTTWPSNMRRTSSMLKRAEFIELFAGLGVTTDLSGTSALNIEKFVCFLFGNKKIASVDELRHKIFCQKIERGKSHRPQPLASLQIKPPNPHNTSKLCCQDVPPSKWIGDEPGQSG